MGNQRRTKGSGGLFQIEDPNGRLKWRAEEWLPADPETGKRYRVSGKGDTPEQAITRLALNKARRLNALPTPQRAPKHTEQPYTPKHRKQRETPRKTWHLSEYLQWHSDGRKVSDKVRKKDYRTLQLHTIPYIGNIPIGELTTGAIRNYWNNLEDEHRDEHGLLRNTYRALATALNYAVKNDIIKTNPLTVIPRPALEERIDPETMGKMIRKTLALTGYLTGKDPNTGKPRYENDPATWARLTLALQGLRPSEALGLTWDKVELTKGTNGAPPHATIGQVLDRDSNTGTLIIRKGTKTGKGRTIALTTDTVKALKNWKREQNKLRKTNSWHPNDGEGMDNLIITKDNGKPIDQNTDRELFAELLEEQQAGIKDPTKKYIFSIGLLRAVSATIRLDAGANPLHIAKAYGHSLEVQQKYYYAGQLKAQVPELSKSDHFFGIQRYDDEEE